MGPALSPLRTALLVVVAVVAVAAGGAVLLADETPRPSTETIDNASERYESLDGFVATVETTTRIGNETMHSTRRVTARPGTGAYRSVALGNTSGPDVTVSNGTVVWLYDRDNGTARRLEVDTGTNSTAVMGGEQVERLLSAALNGDNESAGGVSTLPMVSRTAGPSPSGSLETNGSSFGVNVSYLGTEEIGDRETYVLELTGTDIEEGALDDYSGRVWVDTEWFVALRHRTNFTVDGEPYAVERRYRNVSFDPDLSNVSFELDPSESNVTVESGPSLTEYESRDALARNASLSVPEPDVPADFRFQQGARTVGEARSVTLQYTNGTASVSVTLRNTTRNATDTEGTEVQIGDATGRLDTFGASTLVTWECDGRAYTVIGSNLANETVVDVARSVGCERDEPTGPGDVATERTRAAE
jgi:outer membrane lipoprotein-sorting protein